MYCQVLAIGNIHIISQWQYALNTVVGHDEAEHRFFLS
jgi:hypothetical protein